MRGLVALALLLSVHAASAAGSDPFEAELPPTDPAVASRFTATEAWLTAQLSTQDPLLKRNTLYELGWLWEHAPDTGDQSKSLDYYQQAKDAGSAEAELRLLSIGVSGWFGRKADATTRPRLETLAQGGLVPAYSVLGDCYWDDPCGNPASDAKAFANYQAAWQRGLVWGAIMMGARVRDGKTDADPNTAVTYFRQAIDAGDPRGYSLIADMYRNTDRSIADPVKARDLAAQGAALGDSDAMLLLGEMLADGTGGPRGRKAAAEWLERTLDGGEKAACSTLGQIYEDGVAGSADPAKAANAYRRGVALGSAECMNTLGLLYEGRKLREPIPGSAVHWLEKAFESGIGNAACSLGTMYLDAILVPRASDKAQEWYRKGAAKSRSSCEYGLGLMAEDGYAGHAASIPEAVDWYRKAAQDGDQDADKALARLGAKR